MARIKTKETYTSRCKQHKHRFVSAGIHCESIMEKQDLQATESFWQNSISAASGLTGYMKNQTF